MKFKRTVLLIGIMIMGVLLMAGNETMDEKIAELREQAEEEEKLVLLYFTAEWCPPCQLMKENVLPEEAVQEAIEADYLFLKIDVDEEPETATQYEVRGVPYMLIVDPEGERVSSFSGYREKEQYIETIQEIAEEYREEQE